MTDLSFLFCLALAHSLLVHTHFVNLLGVFIARGKEDSLCTRNLVVGESVYGEKRISVEVSRQADDLINLPWPNGVIYVIWCILNDVSYPLFVIRVTTGG